MSVSTFTGFVVIDGEKVLNYDDLRSIGFVGPSAESEYLGGNHGINGLFQIRPTPKQTELMDDDGLSVALVQTPWFTDSRLAMEPELQLDVIISEDNGEVLDLEYLNGFTRVAYDYTEGGESVNAWGKLSVGAYSSNTPQPEVDLLAAIGWNSPVPVMPSPADILAQLGSQKSLEEQFAEAFGKAQPSFTQPSPPPAPKPAYVPPSFAPPMPPAPEPAAPEEAKPSHKADDMLTAMFGILLR